ncbi:MAG: hypothetical protein PVSMB1_09150 [Gemmatimonadaceae bacterium]
MASTPPMKLPVIVPFTLLALLGCERPQSGVPSGESAKAPIAASDGAGAAVWDNTFGPLIATPSLENGVSTLFMRDTTGSTVVEVELFNHEGRVQRAILRPTKKLHSCAWERASTLVSAAGAPVPPGWSLALAPGMATPIPVDDVSEILPRDSTALVVDIRRLVSALPVDSTSLPFHGLPISVRDAWRLRLADDSSIILVAVTTRALNFESNPRVEIATIVAESNLATENGEWRTAFVQKDAGPEDRVAGPDLLAVLRLKNLRSAVALVREGENGLAIDMVERIASASWRIRWSSSTLPCAR